jgi:hypothetical protein
VALVLAGQEPGWRSALLPASKAALEVREQNLYRVGPNCETWPNTLTENPY